MQKVHARLADAQGGRDQVLFRSEENRGQGQASRGSSQNEKDA